MNAIIENKQKAATVFQVLAEFYKPPTTSFWEDLDKGAIMESIRRTATELYNAGSLDFDLQVPESFEQLTDIYSAALSDARSGAVLPVESLYKTWTQDESCTLPFAKSKGYLQGDPAFHIRFILDQFQIGIPQEYEGTPDHLAILLELLSYFIEFSSEDFTAQFLADHFDWLPEFELKARGAGFHPFYQQATRMLIKLLELQKQTYK